MNKVINNLFTILMIMVIQLNAQGKPELSLQIDEYKVNKSAAEGTADVNIIYSPGDTIEYVITAKNTGDAPMVDPIVIDPVPAGVSYISNSATGEDAIIRYSIDDGMQYLDWPPTYSVRNEEGEIVLKEASPEMVTHLKWEITTILNPGTEKKLSFMVEVK